MDTPERFDSFADFYPFYLNEHANQVSRRLHFVGTSIAVDLKAEGGVERSQGKAKRVVDLRHK